MSIFDDIVNILGKPQDIDPHKLDGDGRSALHHAASKRNAHEVLAAIKAGCDVNLQDKAGRTPLHYAASGNSPKIVALLLEHHATIDIRDGDEQTPFLFAANWGAEASLETLAAHGADVAAHDKNGKTAAHIAVEKGRASLLTLLAGMDGGRVLEKPLFNNPERPTPLIHALYNHNANMALHLLELGADPNYHPPSGASVLDICIRNGQFSITKKCVELGADIVKPQSFPPLITAAIAGDLKMVEYLLQMGADPLQPDKNGRTAPQLIREKIRVTSIVENKTGITPPSPGQLARASNLEQILALLTEAENQHRARGPKPQSAGNAPHAG